jgi:hypothetical protein
MNIDDITLDSVLENTTKQISSLPDDMKLKDEEVEKKVEEVEKKEPEKKEVSDPIEKKEDEVEKKEVETKDDDEEDEDPLITSLVKEVAESFGIEGLSEEDYTDDDEGFKKLVKDSASLIAQTQINNWFNQDELLKKHAEYLLKGGDSKTFLETFYPKEISSQELSEENDSAQDAYLREYFAIRGFSKEEAEEYIKDFEIAGQKYQRALKAKEAIATFQEKKKEDLFKEQEKQIQKQREEVENTWKGIRATVEEKGVVKDFRIREADKKAFIDYISKPVDKQGRTQRQIDADAADLETRLLVDYLMYNKMDISKLIQAKAETTKARSLRKNVAEQQKATPKGGSAGSGGYSKTVNIDELDFDKILGR